jgi:phosphate starvation-inducible PhoH-like protein
LVDAQTRLRRIQGVCHVHLTKGDIVRHRLVQEIVSAYDADPRKNGNRKTRR